MFHDYAKGKKFKYLPKYPVICGKNKNIILTNSFIADSKGFKGYYDVVYDDLDLILNVWYKGYSRKDIERGKRIYMADGTR